jgi:thiol:disulfide interchange protein DsbC
MRVTLLTLCLIAICGAVLPSLSCAAGADVSADLKKTLETRFPEVKVMDVRPAPLPGLYEVFTGDAIVYASATGDYVINGPVMDTKSRRNLTADSLDERNSIDFSKLPLDLAIRHVKGDGSRKLAIFADPDCPFCKKFEQELTSIDNVTVYTFLYPLADLHPDAPEKARNIWCASDRAQAWTQWMLEGKPAAARDCSVEALEKVREVGFGLRIASTPVLFFASGRRVSGAMPAAQVEEKLNKESPAAVAARRNIEAP